MNRYTNISLSEFNPMTLQEKMIVPSIKRKQHDSISADQTAILDKLNKVQPHDKYFNEAQLLKKQITDKISEHATKLAKEGVSNNMLSDTIALNREYNDLASETGKLGMINAHNLKISKIKEDYLKQAKDMNQSPEAAQYWIDEAMKKHMSSPLYDERGRVIDFNVDQNVVKYVDREAKFHEFAKSVDSLTGKSWDDIRSGFGERADGTVYVKESGSKGYNKNNYASLQKVADYMNSQLKDKSSDLYKSEMYNRRDLNNAMLSNLRQAEMYMKEDTESGTSNKISNVQYPSKDGTDNSELPPGLPIGIPNNTPEGITKIGGDSMDTSEIDRIGQKPTANVNLYSNFTGLPFGKKDHYNTSSQPSSNKFTHNEISNPIVRNTSKIIFDKMRTKEGFVFTNKEGKRYMRRFTKATKDSDINNPEFMKEVSATMKMLPEFTYQNTIINTSPALNLYGLMPNQNKKTTTEVNDQLSSDLRSNKRQVINEKGNLVSWNELDSLGEIENVTYDGFESPIKLRDTEGNTTSQKMPHLATIHYKGNKVKQVKVTRIKGLDDRGINDHRQDELNENATIAIPMSQVSPGEYMNIKSDNKELSQIKMRYISPVSDGTQGYYQLKTPQGKLSNLTEDQMISFFNQIK